MVGPYNDAGIKVRQLTVVFGHALQARYRCSLGICKIAIWTSAYRGLQKYNEYGASAVCSQRVSVANF